VIRFRIRRDRQQIGPWWPSDEAAEAAAIELGLALRDEHYDVLHLEPGVVIDCEEVNDEPPAA
jgi:hypothetical protein